MPRRIDWYYFRPFRRSAFPSWLMGLLEEHFEERLAELDTLTAREQVEITVTVTPLTGIPSQAQAPQISEPVVAEMPHLDIPGVFQTEHRLITRNTYVPFPFTPHILNDVLAYVYNQRDMVEPPVFNHAEMNGKKCLRISWVTLAREEVCE
jgi:hypothetical protein